MIVVIDYGMGNLGSVMNMFRRIGVPAVRGRDPEVVATATKLILPGVGAFDRGMAGIEQCGLRSILDRKVLKERVPVLGICLGMQLMCKRSGEGVTPGLGWIDADVVRFRFEPRAGEPAPKIPHMGWSFVEAPAQHALVRGLGDDARFYFVHSYRVVCSDPTDVLLASHYGGLRFCAAMARGNIVGVQFHPEKSHRFGMALLRSYADWSPAGQPVPA